MDAGSGLDRGLLVVENDPMTRSLLADLLEKEGYAVSTAANASDARRVFTATDPDGVILDVDLGPGPTGFDVADVLLAERPDLAVIFLTNLPDARFAGRDPGSLPRGVAYLRKERLVESGALAAAIDVALRGEVDDSYRQACRCSGTPTTPARTIRPCRFTLTMTPSMRRSPAPMEPGPMCTVRAITPITHSRPA